MAFTPLSDDLNIISQLGDRPNTDDGLSASQFKAKFDLAANIIKNFINNTLLQQAAQKPVGNGIVKAANGVLSIAESDTDYLTPDTAAGTYLSKATAANDYLKKTDAATTYLTQDGASSTYEVILNTNQKRHIFAQSTEPTEAQIGDIWLVMPEE